MAKRQGLDLILNNMEKNIVDLDNILKTGSLTNELDFERASNIDRKLRTLIKEQPELANKRRQLRNILKAYENKVWVDQEPTTAKLAESALAEIVAEHERIFYHRRKELIRKKRQALGLSQKDLGKILGHKSVTYISELINGINSFTTNDLVAIHLLLKIDFKDLIPTVLNIRDREKLAISVQELNHPNLKLDEETLQLIAC
jgi:transcriptional regulator with XRE-family HTH domain